MKTTYDCVPCFVRQTLNAVRFATEDTTIIESVLREVLKSVSTMDLTLSPPVMGRRIHQTIRNYSGSDDPYKKIKEKFNAYALDLYPDLDEKVKNSRNPFETAVRLAIAGNIIDFGVNTDVDHSVVNKTIEKTLSESPVGDMAYLQNTLQKAQRILYLGDNTGEIVFDQLLIRQLPMDRVTYAVRGKPIINDATMEDAVNTGMTSLVNVIDNGSDVPGTDLSQCSETFRQAFRDADVIIAKGQGNYETLSHSDQNIFFLLKAKCAVVAEHIGCEIGDTVIQGRKVGKVEELKS